MHGDDASARRPGRPPEHGLRQQPWWPAAVAVAAVYGWWAVGLEPFSWQAAVAVVAPAVIVAAGAARWPRLGRGGAADTSTAVAHAAASPPGLGVWAVLALAAAGWQLVAYLQHPREDHPTISSLTNAVLDTHGARSAAFVVWLLGIVALVRR